MNQGNKIIIILLVFFLTGCTSRYKKGNEYLARKDYQRAKEEFESVRAGQFKTDSVMGKLHYVNGVIYFNEGNYDSALAEFSRVEALNDYSGQSNAYVNYISGIKKIKRRDIKDAWKNFNEIFISERLNLISDSDDVYIKAKPKLIYFMALDMDGSTIESMKQYVTSLLQIPRDDEIYPFALAYLPTAHKKLVSEIKRKQKEYEASLRKIRLSQYITITGIEKSGSHYIVNGAKKYLIRKKGCEGEFKVIMSFKDNFNAGFQNGISPVFCGKSINTTGTWIEYVLGTGKEKFCKILLFGWEEYFISSEEMKSGILKAPGNYKFCYIYNIDSVKIENKKNSIYADAVGLYVLNENDGVVYTGNSDRLEPNCGIEVIQSPQEELPEIKPSVWDYLVFIKECMLR